jgi:hypothetical protein
MVSSFAIKTIPETAAALGMTYGTVRYLETVALRKLRRRLGIQTLSRSLTRETDHTDGQRADALASAWPKPEEISNERN